MLLQNKSKRMQADAAAEVESVALCLSLRRRGLAERCLAACDQLLAQRCTSTKVKACRGWALGCLGRYEEAVVVLDDALLHCSNPRQRVNIQLMIREFQGCIGFADVVRRRWEEAQQQPLGVEWYGQTVQARTNLPDGKGVANQYMACEDGVAFIMGRDQHRWEIGGVVIDQPIAYHPFPCNQITDAKHFGKRQTLPLKHSQLDFAMENQLQRLRNAGQEPTFQLLFEVLWRYHPGPLPIDLFPVMANVHQKPGVYQPDPRCDVWALPRALHPLTHHTLRTLLDARAAATVDYPMPMYQNIIDPNLLVHKIPPHGFHGWSPSVFHVTEVTRLDVLVILQLYAKSYCNAKLPGAAMRAISEFVGTNRRPTAKLMTRVHDLDPGKDALLHKTVEEVFNAAIPLLAQLRRPALLLPGPLQAVVKAQRIYLEPGEEYEGVWHYDGMAEHIVAVAIYYYRCSPELEGGAIEFMDRSPRTAEFWVRGDCVPDPLTKDDVPAYYEEKPHCKVPVGEGTLVVFSNYQFIHRVLRMKHTGSAGIASRDFLLFFIVDQREPLKTTEEVVPLTNARETRDELLLQQLQPAGTFGISQEHIYSTGNGSVAQLGWIHSPVREVAISCVDRSGMRQLQAFDHLPPVGRGLSWVFEAGDEDLCNPKSDFMEYRYHEGPDTNSPYRSEYYDIQTNNFQTDFPVGGILCIAHEFSHHAKHS